MDTIVRILIKILITFILTTKALAQQDQNSTEQPKQSSFIVETDIAVRQIPQQQYRVLEQRWENVLNTAFKLSTSAHLGQHNSSAFFQNSGNETNPFKTQILGTRNENGITIMSFTCSFNENPVQAAIIVEDLGYLTLSHISAALQYPVVKIRALFQREQQEEFRWWIIAVIVGSGLLLVALGWCCLFMYYNTCGRPLPRYTPEGSHKVSRQILQAELSSEGDLMREKQNSFHLSTEQQLEFFNKNDKFAEEQKPELIPATVGGQVASRQQLEEPLQDIAPKAIQTTSRETSTEVPEAVQPQKQPDAPVIIHVEIQPEPPSNFAQTALDKTSSPQNRPKSADVKDRPFIPEEPVHRWSPYESGDFLASTYSIGFGLSGHPRPLLSSGSGVIELATSSPSRNLEFVPSSSSAN